MHISLGMAALGAFLGVLIDWSNSPIIAAVVAALFGLLGSASIFKLDLTKEANKLRLQLVTATLFWVCSTAVFTMYASAIARPFLTDWLRENTHPLPHASLIEGIVLRAQLRALGASENEIARALDRDPVNSLATAQSIYEAASKLLDLPVEKTAQQNTNSRTNDETPDRAAARNRFTPATEDTEDATSATRALAEKFVREFDLLNKNSKITEQTADILLKRIEYNSISYKTASFRDNTDSLPAIITFLIALEKAHASKIPSLSSTAAAAANAALASSAARNPSRRDLTASSQEYYSFSLNNNNLIP